MSDRAVITRNLLSEQVRAAIIQRIFEGQLPAGERINESDLATELGVSRTPLREALHHLEQQRFVEARPGRGFVVASLSKEDVHQVYPLVSLLEGFALRTSPIAPSLVEAQRMNDQMFVHREDPETCLALDAEFHEVLVGGCGNELLLTTLADLKQLMQRYEHAYMQETAAHPDGKRTMESSVIEHRAILDALSRGDRDAAGSALELNWQNGMNRLLELLDAEEKR
jgi:DNA-binding GntR family transcriptional regulator